MRLCICKREAVLGSDAGIVAAQFDVAGGGLGGAKDAIVGLSGPAGRGARLQRRDIQGGGATGVRALVRAGSLQPLLPHHLLRRRAAAQPRCPEPVPSPSSLSCRHAHCSSAVEFGLEMLNATVFFGVEELSTITQVNQSSNLAHDILFITNFKNLTFRLQQCHQFHIPIL